MGNPFKKNYTAEIEINATNHIIWKVLMDTPNYHLWNSFTPKIELEWKIGSKVVMTVNMKKGKKPIRQTEYLLKLNPPFEFSWGMNWGIFLKAERIQRLTDLPNGNATYFTEDKIHGLLCPVVHFLYGKSISEGFMSLAKALKKYTEDL